MLHKLLCFIIVCKQILFKEFVPTSNFTLTYLHMQMVTHHLILAFKWTLCYLQHSLHYLMMKNVYEIYIVFLIICLSVDNSKLFTKNNYFRENGENMS